MPQDSGWAHTHCHQLHLPKLCSPHYALQWPLPTFPSFSSMSFSCFPHPQSFLPFLSTLSNFLSWPSASEPAHLHRAAKPASLQIHFIPVGPCSVYTMWLVWQPLPFTGGGTSVVQAPHGGSLVEHCVIQLLENATCSNLMLVNVSLKQRRGSSINWVQQRRLGKHRNALAQYFILSAIFSMPEV